MRFLGGRSYLSKFTEHSSHQLSSPTSPRDPGSVTQALHQQFLPGTNMGPREQGEQRHLSHQWLGGSPSIRNQSKPTELLERISHSSVVFGSHPKGKSNFHHRNMPATELIYCSFVKCAVKTHIIKFQKSSSINRFQLEWLTKAQELGEQVY